MLGLRRAIAGIARNVLGKSQDNVQALEEVESEEDGDATSESLNPKDPRGQPVPTPQIPPQNRVETTSGTGKVTILEPTLPRGVIDGTYFFNRESAPSGVKLGSSVEYRAQRKSKFVHWEVTFLKLVITDQDRADMERQRYRTIMGIVSGLKENSAFITYGQANKNEVQEVPTSMLPSDYKVLINDYLRITFKMDNPNADEEPTATLLSIEPTNRKIMIGELVETNGVLSIDYQVKFDQKVLAPGFWPLLHHHVLVTAVESQCPPFKWRAISIKPSEFVDYSSPAEPSANDSILEFNKTWSEPLEFLQRDKCGIIVRPRKELYFGGIRLGMSVTMSLDIENISSEYVILKSITVEEDQSVCDFEVHIKSREDTDMIATIEAKSSYSFQITCHPKMLGLTNSLCILDFGSFKIARRLSVICLTDEEILIAEVNAKKYVPKEKFWEKFRSQKNIQGIIDLKTRRGLPGPPSTRVPFFEPVRIKSNMVPMLLFKIVRDMNEERLLSRYPELGQELSIHNYATKFRVNLWLEELENIILGSRNNLTNVILIPHPGPEENVMSVVVFGLKGFQPSLLKGDRVEVVEIENPKGVRAGGYINGICPEENELLLKMSKEFCQIYNGKAVSVHFLGSRSVYKRAHFAVERTVKYLGESWLFPSGTIEVKPPRIHFIESEGDEDTGIKVGPKQSLTLFKPIPERKTVQNSIGNRNLGQRSASIFTFTSDTRGPDNHGTEALTLNWVNKKLNNEQRNAVRRILRGQCRPLPYIIFGPPGTGKTVTLIESIIQVYKLDSYSRSLVVAPSNSAADVIAQHLVDSGMFSPGDFVRLVGFMRLEWQIPASLRQYCYDGETLDVIARSRLIICTCGTAGQFFNLGLDSGHFTHVFIDEAGYCTEPEAIVPITLVALEKEGQVILAGDPKQLGPVLMSSVAEKCGLDLSLLERFMKLPPYSRDSQKFPIDKYNPICLTKLVINYRAHPTLLKVPSKLFYDDDLVAAPQETDVSLCQTLDFLNVKGLPLLFHGVNGKQDREYDSPSLYNAAEVMLVVKYIRELRNHGVAFKEVGVITPYRKQVEKIRRALEQGLLSDDLPKVGSVEEFQGAERRVMILSLVRSENSNMIRDWDKKERVTEYMSFIYSAKRFNVAITRAKALLIVIGNPHMLRYDMNWLVFLKYCIELGAYKGCDVPVELNKAKVKYLTEIGKESETWMKTESGSKLSFDDECSGWEE